MADSNSAAICPSVTADYGGRVLKSSVNSAGWSPRKTRSTADPNGGRSRTTTPIGVEPALRSLARDTTGVSRRRSGTGPARIRGTVLGSPVANADRSPGSAASTIAHGSRRKRNEIRSTGSPKSDGSPRCSPCRTPRENRPVSSSSPLSPTGSFRVGRSRLCCRRDLRDLSGAFGPPDHRRNRRRGSRRR